MALVTYMEPYSGVDRADGFSASHEVKLEPLQRNSSIMHTCADDDMHASFLLYLT